MQEEETNVEYVVISRRARDRAGLRYQRRGIDDEAHVANFVETETIMRVQVRSSIDHIQLTFLIHSLRGKAYLISFVSCKSGAPVSIVSRYTALQRITFTCSPTVLDTDWIRPQTTTNASE